MQKLRSALILKLSFHDIVENNTTYYQYQCFKNVCKICKRKHYVKVCINSNYYYNIVNMYGYNIKNAKLKKKLISL